MSQTARPQPRPPRARTPQEPDRRSADRRLRWTVLAVVAGLLLLLGAVVVLSQTGADDGSTAGTAPTSRAVPTGVDQGTLAVPVAPDVTPRTGAPQLYVWEDFQCPACAAVEARTGDQVVALARSGDAQVFWRVTTFLDDRYPGESSERAAAAWGCAVDAGRAVEMHEAIFAAQPATEGDGWSDAQLLRLGRASGITGADYSAYRACVEDGTYRDWAARSTALFHREGVQGTPAAYLDGHLLDTATLADPAALADAVRTAREDRAGG